MELGHGHRGNSSALSLVLTSLQVFLRYLVGFLVRLRMTGQCIYPIVSSSCVLMATQTHRHCYCRQSVGVLVRRHCHHCTCLLYTQQDLGALLVLFKVSANCQMLCSSWIDSVRRWYVCPDIYVVESTDKVSCAAWNEEREARGLLDQLKTPHASTRDERQRGGSISYSRRVRFFVPLSLPDT